MVDMFDRWPSSTVIKVYNEKYALLGVLRKNNIDIFDTVVGHLSNLGDYFFVSVRIANEDFKYWTSLAVDDVENLIIEDFKYDHYFVNLEILFGNNFPLSTAATWKVFTGPYIDIEESESDSKPNT